MKANPSEAPAPADLFTRFLTLSHRFHISYWAIRGGEFLVRVLPLRISYAIATAVGCFVYLFWHDKRQSVIANMGRVLGDGAGAPLVRRMARSAFRHYSKYLVEFLRLPALNREDICRLAHVVGWEHLDHALQAGQGVIFVGLHFGSWDLAGALVALRGYPVNVVADTFQPPRLNELIQRYRRDKGVKIIPQEQAAKGAMRVLRRNEILGLLVDRPLPGNGVPVQFCGAPTEVPAGAAALALKTGAKLLPGYLARQPDNTFRGAIAPYLEVQQTGDDQHDIQQATQQIMHALEEAIRQYPDQWYAFRRMWPEPS